MFGTGGHIYEEIRKAHNELMSVRQLGLELMDEKNPKGKQIVRELDIVLERLIKIKQIDDKIAAIFKEEFGA